MEVVKIIPKFITLLFLSLRHGKPCHLPRQREANEQLQI